MAGLSRMTESLFGVLRAEGISFSECPIAPVQLRDLLLRVRDGQLTSLQAKYIMRLFVMSGNDKTLDRLLAERSSTPDTDAESLDVHLEGYFVENQGFLSRYRAVPSTEAQDKLKKAFFGKFLAGYAERLGLASPCALDAKKISRRFEEAFFVYLNKP
jgi:Asp-tRNA(Asn)/Glu-tRNA(Gln) amidotransferase B subunit